MHRHAVTRTETDRPSCPARHPRRGPLARAAHLALSGGLLLAAGLPIHAHAQGTGAAQPGASADAAKRYDIPAGPLGGALARFAAASGVLLAGPAELVQGRTSAGLSGSHTVAAAIQALLAGTGLEAVRQPNGTYTLRAAAAAPAPPPAPAPAPPPSSVSLAPVTVAATRERDGTSEGSGSYTTGAMNTATPLPLSIRETPQSVTVITRDRIDDQGLTKAKDIMDNTPGISSSGTAPYREAYHARGFDITNYMFDGLTVGTNNSRAGMFMNDLAMYDRVEVVRGSTGLMQGTGSPSAAVNFVRKRPTRQFQASVQGHAGRWNDYGLQADVSSPVNQAGTLRVRAVVMGKDSDSFQDVVTERRALAYVIAEADLTRDTLLTAGLSHQRNDNITTYSGIPTAPDGSDLRLPRSTFLGNKWNFWNDRTTTAFLELEHRFANEWKLKFAGARILGYQEQARASVYYNDATLGWDQNGGLADVDSQRTSVALTASGPFRILGRKHELVVGASRRTEKEANDTAGYWGYVFATGIDIFNWTHDAPRPPMSVDYKERRHKEQKGVYAATRLNLADPLKLLLGLRLDWYRHGGTADIQDFEATTWTLYPDDFKAARHLTKYAGIVYDLDKQHSLYASYTDIFLPQTERDHANRSIKPIVGKNHELGIKGEYFGGALNLAATVFLVDEDNRAIEDGPCTFDPDTVCYRAAGVVRSRGFELEAQGAVTRNWQVGAGYTYVSTKVHKDPAPGAVGVRQNTELPARLLKVSTAYRVPQSPWRLGANVRWQSGISHFDDWMGFPYRTSQGGLTLADAMVGYQVSANLDLQLNVFNALDKHYYRSINTQPVHWGGNTVYGEPRKFLLTGRYRF